MHEMASPVRIRVGEGEGGLRQAEGVGEASHHGDG